MVKIHRVQNFEEKQNLFEHLPQNKFTWVVADVQSRTFLQNKLLKQSDAIEETSVIIAGELWQELLFLADPQYKLISEDLARSLVWEWVRPLNLNWAKTPASARRILQQMEHLGPILAHKGKENLLKEWFNANPESVFRWRHWYEVGTRIWEEFAKRKWALPGWVPALLVQPEMPKPIWPKRLYFDLGVRMSPIEAQVVRELARVQDLDVVIPRPAFSDAFVTTCEAYRLIDDTPDRRPELSPPEIVFTAKPAYRRFSTHLAEAKDAVAQIRAWLDEGVKPAQIAIVTPDMEKYGSCLKLYLQQEGVPIQKYSEGPLHSHPDVARWLSALRIKLNRFNRKDLEVHLFQDAEHSELSYDEFKRLYGRFYDVDDIKRWPELEKKLAIAGGTGFTQEEFMVWALKLAPQNSDGEKIAALVSEFARDGLVDVRVSAEVWLGMLEDLGARLPVAAPVAAADGVHILNLGACEWVPATHICFLNASENVLRRWNDSPFGAAEAGRLLRELGFAVSSHESQPSEFELCWLLSRKWSGFSFSFADADFRGETLTPSRFWLMGAFQKGDWKSVSSPRPARWDDLQRQSVAEIAQVRGWTEVRAQLAERRLLEDLGLEEPAPVKASGEQRLSISSIEQYRGCPFVFAARKVFKLSDEPSLDLDLDRRTLGRLMHRMFARLTQNPFRADYSDDELSAIIETARTEEDVQFADERMWVPVRQAHMRLARQFLVMEGEYRRKFPKATTAAAETEFNCRWDPVKREWTKAEGEGLVSFTGRIDRVDADGEGRYALIDYKSSIAPLRHWDKWLEQDQLQLGVYSDLVERGMTELPPGEVEAAVYFVSKAESRNKGFYLRENAGRLIEAEPRIRNQISSEQKKELFEKMRGVIGETVDQIREGRLPAVPKDLSQCDGCGWNRLCRAKHLN